MKNTLKRLVPDSTWQRMRRTKHRAMARARHLVELSGFNVARSSDYYSPLPRESKIRENVARWNTPSAMTGIAFDLDASKTLLEGLLTDYLPDFQALRPYEENLSIGFGPGYPRVDALVLYAMVRRLAPKRYYEIGSGLSTYYCSLAAAANERAGSPLSMKCIEPYPFRQLYSIPGIEIIQDEVQNVDKSVFSELAENDILFIDSSHVVNIDGDVPFLFLEVLPALKKGVVVHVHDIPFPFNTPYPAEQWILGRTETSPFWPMYWNEAMLLQALLMFNDSFEISLSLPMVRYHDEGFLRARIPGYKTVEEEPNTFSSIWLRRVR